MNQSGAGGSIGIFDSGFGGLHVLRGIVEKMPQYSYIYLGDNARAPYGPRSAEEVYEFTEQGVEFLLAQGATLVILACNTASSEALRRLQADARFQGKVLGVLIPFAEAAAAMSRTKRIGVIATIGTVRSEAYVREILKIEPHAAVFQAACPRLVPLIESGQMHSEEVDSALSEYLLPLLENDIDTLVLGCTHYGILENKIREIVGPDMQIISEHDVVPEKLYQYLQRHVDIDAALDKNGGVHFFTTGPTDHFEKLGGLFFGKPLHAHQARIE